MSEPQGNKVIRISKDDALSSHVEDMLKRQMSMRGDPGVTRERKRSWFYQNWFVFGIVGTVGAVLAWAIIEPNFQDHAYFQGKIESVSQLEGDFHEGDANDKEIESVLHNMITISIKGEKILVAPNAKEIEKDGSYVRFQKSSLEEGETVGVYLERSQARTHAVNMALYIVRDPPPQKPGDARLSLDQISSHHGAIGLLIFPLVAGMIGLCIGAADGIVCRLPRRALLCGGVGLVAGFVGGFISSIIANIVYAPLTHLANSQTHGGIAGLSSLGFAIQLIGRSLAWALAGLAMGLGQGISLRSKRLLLYGLLGGVVGGLLGGVMFDPIDMILLGPDKVSAAYSRLIGFAIIGLSVGAMIGLVELLARDAWLRMTQGPLTGKEFLIFKDVMNVGSSPRSDIYLFNDPLVAEQHAIIRGLGDECEIEARATASPVLLNNRSVTRARLRHGDNVTIGRTSFVFQQRKN